MFKTAWMLFALLPLQVWMSAAALAAAPPAAEAFGAVPQTDDVTLSPDGKTLAWTTRSNADAVVVIFDVDARKIKRKQRVENTMKLRSVTWADNEMLLISVSVTDPHARNEDERFEYFRTLALDTTTGATKFMLMAGGDRAHVTGASVLSMRSAKPKTVMMVTSDYSASNSRAREQLGSHIENRRKDSGWALSVFEVSTVTGSGTLVESGNPFTNDFVVDKDGRVVGRSDWNPDAKVFRVLVKKGPSWQEIYSATDGTRLFLQGVNPEGTAILALSNKATEGGKLLGLPLDGSPVQVAFADPHLAIESVIHDRFSDLPVAVFLGGATPRYHWLDPKDQARHETVQRAFPGKVVHLYSESLDRQRIVAYVYGASVPAVYYLVDFKAHSADVVGDEYPALAKAALGEVSVINYGARDGTQIPAYLTLPPGLEAKHLPLVILPHGGPEARDDPFFDWWPQFLATRGYAVLQPQFRGSAGFGNEWRLAGRRQWGGLMQDDLTDGVKAMVDQGIADARRVCIVGASYGGYAALAGAAFTPKLYACAVSVNGVSNLSEMLGWEVAKVGKESNTVGYWQESIGPKLDPVVIAKSPAKAVEHVKAPILLIYSADDTVVPPSQSREMAQALKEHGTPVTLVKLDGDDHWLSRTDTRVQMLKNVDDFLAATLRK